MELVAVKDITDRLPIPLTPGEENRVEILIGDAITQITTAFLKEGRDFSAELVSVPWLLEEARRVVREMVSAAVIMGPNAGVRTASSTTGPQSDSITYTDPSVVSFAGVRLLDEQRNDLGLRGDAGPRGSFPPPPPWPEVMSR